MPKPRTLARPIFETLLPCIRGHAMAKNRGRVSALSRVFRVQLSVASQQHPSHSPKLHQESKSGTSPIRETYCRAAICASAALRRTPPSQSRTTSSNHLWTRRCAPGNFLGVYHCVAPANFPQHRAHPPIVGLGGLQEQCCLYRSQSCFNQNPTPKLTLAYKQNWILMVLTHDSANSRRSAENRTVKSIRLMIRCPNKL